MIEYKTSGARWAAMKMAPLWQIVSENTQQDYYEFWKKFRNSFSDCKMII